PLAGYGEWSDLCQQPLLWLGLPDAMVSVFQAMAEDPDREILGRLLTMWEKAFGTTPAMVRDAVNHAFYSPEENAELREILHDIAGERGEINRRRLGWWIKRHAGRIVDGRRFVRGSGSRSAERWQVQSVLPVSGGPPLESVSDDVTLAAEAYARASRG